MTYSVNYASCDQTNSRLHSEKMRNFNVSEFAVQPDLVNNATAHHIVE